MANASGEALASTPALAVIAPDRQGPLSQYRSLSAVVRGWKSVFCVLVGETLCVYSSHDAQAPDMLVALQGARVMLSNDATDFAAAKEEKEAQKYPHSFFIDSSFGSLQRPIRTLVRGQQRSRALRLSILTQ